jgi:hypothetical protein
LPIIVTEAMNCANSAPRNNHRLPPAVAALVILLLSLGLSAQDSGIIGEDLSQAEVFTPFVSRLETETLDTAIRLTWRDIPELPDARYNIYRAEVEITSRTFDRAVLRATVDSGVGTYTDPIGKNGPYYYAVVTVDATGEELPIFIPFRNTNVLAAVITDVPEGFAVTGISNLSAQADGEEILLSYAVTGDIETLLLYRSASPIRDSESLSRAIRVDSPDPASGSYRDYVIPGIPYYYALLDAAVLETAGVELVAGQNTLEDPVELPLGRRYPGVTAGSRSSEVLPILILEQAVTSGASLPRSTVEIPETVAMSASTARQVDRLLAPIDMPGETSILPDILAAERSPGGEKNQGLVLATIVNDSFALGNYELSIRQLENLLTIPLGEDLEYRTRYYYGQSLYFQGEYERAFLQFVLIRDWDYAKTKIWMDRILADMSRA